MPSTPQTFLASATPHAGGNPPDAHHHACPPPGRAPRSHHPDLRGPAGAAASHRSRSTTPGVVPVHAVLPAARVSRRSATRAACASSAERSLPHRAGPRRADAPSRRPTECPRGRRSARSAAGSSAGPAPGRPWRRSAPGAGGEGKKRRISVLSWGRGTGAALMQMAHQPVDVVMIAPACVDQAGFG